MMRSLFLGFWLSLAVAAPGWSQQAIQQQPQIQQHGKGLWTASVASLLAASAADMQSSMGRLERNPVLANGQGRFNTQGVALKGLITGGVVGVQWLLLRKHPEALRHAAIANFGMAAVFGGAAYYNHTNQK